MNISDITDFLEELAPTSLQESYDNAGLLTGDRQAPCRGVLVSLDVTEEVIAEAVRKNCNMVVAHHPIIFRGLKKITGSSYVERTVISAIKNDVAIYAIHTNLDNIVDGVSGRMAQLLGLKNISVLDPKPAPLKKLYTYVPVAHLEKLRAALFETGAGHIGRYSECSFSSRGMGTFKAGEGTNPFVGAKGQLHEEEEFKLEMIFPAWLEKKLIRTLRENHPYEEVAFEVIGLDNRIGAVGSGVTGEWEEGMDESAFMALLHKTFQVSVVRHTAFTRKKIRKVAICGGAGSFLTFKALASGAQAFITADFKYHEFFDADQKILVADIGHYESEQFTIDLVREKIEQKFPNFAVLKTGVNTNPVRYSCQ